MTSLPIIVAAKIMPLQTLEKGRRPVLRSHSLYA
jgi:hypothetical protein